MAFGRGGTVAHDLRRLFEFGTTSGLSEAELLDRFARSRDESAFETLVARHGPMVMGVCRRLLADPTDADDAFQATFLVLARRAGSIARPERLASWLHGVARRVALRARKMRAQQSSRISTTCDLNTLAHDVSTTAFDAIEHCELVAALDEEVARLPAFYRAAVVLCLLEGRSHDEAALVLDRPVGTVRSRLARGRALLRSRLARRGFAASAALAATEATAHASATALSPALVAATTLAALMTTRGTVVGTFSTAASALAHKVLQAMFWSHVKVIAAVTVCAAVGTVWTGSRVAAWSSQKAGSGAPSGLTPGGAAGVEALHRASDREVAKIPDGDAATTSPDEKPRQAPAEKEAKLAPATPTQGRPPLPFDPNASKPFDRDSNEAALGEQVAISIPRADRGAPRQLEVQLRNAARLTLTRQKLHAAARIATESYLQTLGEFQLLYAKLLDEIDEAEGHRDGLIGLMGERKADLIKANAGAAFREKQYQRIKELVERKAVPDIMLAEEEDHRASAQAALMATKARVVSIQYYVEMWQERIRRLKEIEAKYKDSPLVKQEAK
ncbi:MAG: RNA polymerase sigma factor [Planctomycetota bacterium]|nr:RNA polymerase sigma factor [Planctomycetota bacterium]